MGYPNVTNPSEKLRYDEINVVEIAYNEYRVSAIVNGEFKLKDIMAPDDEFAVNEFKDLAQRWAKYVPNYEELV